MDRVDLESRLHQEPFLPLRLHLQDRRRLDIPFKHVVVFRASDVILFKGVVQEGSRVAKGYEVIPYTRIDHVEPLGRAKRRRRA